MDHFEIDLLRDILVSLFEPNELMRFVRESDFRSVRFPNGLELYLRGHEYKYDIVCNHPSEIPTTYLLALRDLNISDMFNNFALARQDPSKHHLVAPSNG